MHNKLVLCFIIFSLGLDLCGKDIWININPHADAMVFIDFGQAEKSMEKDIWNQINKDKKAAFEKEKAEGSEGVNIANVFDDFTGLNPAVLINITAVSHKPFRLMIEGVIRFNSKEIKRGDATIKALVKKLSDWGCDLSEEKTDKGFKQVLTIKDGKSAEPMSFSMVSSGSGEYEFCFLYNLKKKIVLPPSKYFRSHRKMLESFKARTSDPVSFFVLNSIRWMFLLPKNKENYELRHLMAIADSIGGCIKIQGNILHLLLSADFGDNIVANRYAREVKDLVDKAKQIIQGIILRDLSADVVNTSVGVSVAIDIRAAWSTLMNLKATEQSVSSLQKPEKIKE